MRFMRHVFYVRSTTNATAFLQMYDPIPPHIPHGNTQTGTNMEEQSQSEEHRTAAVTLFLHCTYYQSV